MLRPTDGGSLMAMGCTIADGYETLLTICRRFPNRTVGGAGEDGATAFYAEQLAAMGCRNVLREPVPCLSPDFERCVLRYPDATGENLTALPILFTGSTPQSGLVAELVYFDSFAQIDFERDRLAGRIVVLYGWLGDYSFTDWYAALCRAGAVAIVVIRNAEFATCYALPPAAVACGAAPAVSIAHAAGQQLLRSGVTTAYLDLQSSVRDAFGHNVIGCLPASAPLLDDRIFIVSCHVDAKPVRPAAADNAVGAAMALAVLQTLVPVARRRDVWFVGYTDEEHGFGGSKQFAGNHRKLVDRCWLQLYYDGHGTIVGDYQTQVAGGGGALLSFVSETAADIGLQTSVKAEISSLDPVVLYQDDVPSVINLRAPQRTWHTMHDVPEDLSPIAMRSGVHLYAELLYQLCTRVELPLVRETPAAAKAQSRARRERWDPVTLAEARAGAPAQDKSATASISTR